MRLIFEWDDKKSRQNLKLHKITFEEAKTTFNDPFLISFPDDVHSDTEERLLSMGRSLRGKVLLVVHTERHLDDGSIIVRMISARKATSSERKVYEESEE
jgi:uncharacterized DUF497 family protein